MEVVKKKIADEVVEAIVSSGGEAFGLIMKV